VNPFTAAKYDYVMAGKAEFTPEERSVTTCSGAKGKRRNEGHRNGGPGEEPLFTDFTASNLGLPPNPSLLSREHPTNSAPRPTRMVSNFWIWESAGRSAESQSKSFLGENKTFTLRNVAKRRVPTSSKPTCTTDISSRLRSGSFL